MKKAFLWLNFCSLTLLVCAITYAPFVVPGRLVSEINYAPLWEPPNLEEPGEFGALVHIWIFGYSVQVLAAIFLAAVVYKGTLLLSARAKSPGK